MRRVGDCVCDSWVYVWEGGLGWYLIGVEWTGVVITSAGLPDQRYSQGRRMLRHFNELDVARRRQDEAS